MFEVGDWVKIVAGYHRRQIGQVGRVVGVLVQRSWPIEVQLLNGKMWYGRERELVPVAVCPTCGQEV